MPIIIIGLIILAIIIVVAIFYIFVYIILPIAGILMVITAIIGAGFGLVTSIISFIKAIKDNINPYKTYVDGRPAAASGVKRGYFFGPGYHQVAKTAKDAFEGQSKYLDILSSFRKRHADYAFSRLWDWSTIKVVFVWIFYIMAVAFFYAFGFVWIAVFSAILASITFIGMCLFFLFFGILWSIDRGRLFIRSIQSRCGNCKRTSVVPNFICPDCGNEHTRLTPGPYGIFNRKCTCATRLPTTFLNGRSRLKASCPFCTTKLAAGDAQQFGIQVIGGVSAGKTSFIAAFWHQYINKLNAAGIDYDMFPEESFEELADWYRQGISDATLQTNANMYSIIHKGKTECQLAIYDIAGEAFSNLSGDIQQQQFRYCEGLVFVVDPTASPEDVNYTFSDFINNFRELKGTHSKKMSEVPVAVVVSKADLFKSEFDLSSDEMRHYSSQDFLQNYGFGAVRNLFDSEFSNIRYFPVSAMGHSGSEGQAYKPWGVMEPMAWIINSSGEKSVTELKEIF